MSVMRLMAGLAPIDLVTTSVVLKNVFHHAVPLCESRENQKSREKRIETTLQWFKIVYYRGEGPASTYDGNGYSC